MHRENETEKRAEPVKRVTAVGNQSSIPSVGPRRTLWDPAWNWEGWGIYPMAPASPNPLQTRGLTPYLPSCACTWLNSPPWGQRKSHDTGRHEHSRQKLAACPGRRGPRLQVHQRRAKGIRGGASTVWAVTVSLPHFKVSLPTASVNHSLLVSRLSGFFFPAHFQTPLFLPTSCLNVKLVPSWSLAGPLTRHFLPEGARLQPGLRSSLCC